MNATAQKAKHTPGPWKTEPGWVEPGRYSVTATFANRERGLVCSTDGTPFRECEQANARLMAAAPELLEALRFYRAICGNTCAVVDRESANQAWKMANAAIAKATGGA